MISPRVHFSFGIGLLAAVFSPVVGHAQEGAQQQAPPCSAPEYRQFDFWLGTWNVETPDGNIAGTNEITRILGGCALREAWTGAGGSRGTSYNIFDSRTSQWHQTWVDNGGLLLVLDGAFEDGKMVLRGKKHLGDTLTVMHEISWEPTEDNRVVQRWTMSRDEGATWQQVFEGIYIPRDDN
jgi:hypothetical protein